MSKINPDPALSPAKNIPELSFRAIFLGLLLSVVMGAANVYMGLKAGMTVSASIPAAVISMLILRGILRNGSILESNQVQTAASAGEALAAGVIFTMPAMVMIGVWLKFDWLMTSIIAFTGGTLGILFMIPMRKVFITGNKDLPYPEAIACAEVLKAGHTDSKDGQKTALAIVWGAMFGAAFEFCSKFMGIFSDTLEGAVSAANRVFYFGGNVSPALVAIGFIIRLRVVIFIFIGGVIGWIIALPLLGSAGLENMSALDIAWTLWKTKIRYIGVGAMLVGGVLSIINVRAGLSAAVSQLAKHLGGTHVKALENTDRDISTKTILFFLSLAIAGVTWVYFQFTGNIYITIIAAVLMVVMSFFFTAVASYIVGLVGNSNSPTSGMVITAVLITGACLFLLGFSGLEGMAATLGVAAIVCCAAASAGDVCNDLKTGSIVGASPFRQQIMQILGVGVASLVMAPVLQLLHETSPGGIGGKELPAPQAALFASLAEGFFGDVTLPWDLVVTGMLIGVAIFIADILLKRSGSKHRAHVMPIAVGIYLPFTLILPMMTGAIIANIFARNVAEEKQESVLQRGVLYSSGLIAGEALMGVGIAFLSGIFGISRLSLDLSSAMLMVSTLIGIAILLFVFVKVSKPKSMLE